MEKKKKKSHPIPIDFQNVLSCLFLRLSRYSDCSSMQIVGSWSLKRRPPPSELLLLIYLDVITENQKWIDHVKVAKQRVVWSWLWPNQSRPEVKRRFEHGLIYFIFFQTSRIPLRLLRGERQRKSFKWKFLLACSCSWAVGFLSLSIYFSHSLQLFFRGRKIYGISSRPFE